MSPIAPPHVEVTGMTRRFGSLVALDDVSLAFRPGTLHAILGENGAGKSTLVKCLMGYHRPDAGSVVVDGQRHAIASPREARRLGFGMVYQHFTLVPGMTVAENLLVSDPDLPAVVHWREARARLRALLADLPFSVDLGRPVATLAAGEKQKLEIVKQLYLRTRMLVLDEPTSVLTPAEADQLLGLLHTMTREGRLTAVIITHKFREVLGYADEVTVLRAGRRVGGGPVAGFTRDDLVRLMIGRGALGEPAPRAPARPGPVALRLRDLRARDDRGVPTVRGVDLGVRAGEIVGVAGVSGNGQRELVEVLGGQREAESGEVRVKDEVYRGARAQQRRLGMAVLPEEPLGSAGVRGMTVAENLALRSFDAPGHAAWGWLLRRRALRESARALIARFRIATRGPDAPLETLSGGNVQRTVLARELSAEPEVLVAQNPCAGLDVAATADVRDRMVSARNGGAAVLLVSEDLDEVLELSDRVAVMFEGRIVYETPRDRADVQTVGRYMTSQP